MMQDSLDGFGDGGGVDAARVSCPIASTVTPNISYAKRKSCSGYFIQFGAEND